MKEEITISPTIPLRSVPAQAGPLPVATRSGEGGPRFIPCQPGWRRNARSLSDLCFHV